MFSPNWANFPAMASDSPGEYLRRLGQCGEGPFDIALAALMISALDHPTVPLAPYVAHLQGLEDAARAENGKVSRLETAIHSVTELMITQHGYDGDRLSYDDPCNADLISVIDRRRGMPVALGILYLHVARAIGCIASGLNTPGHFLLRLCLNEDAALLDPFSGGVAVERIISATPPPGEPAQVDSMTVEEVNDADVLLRLQNNLKLRALRAGEFTRAMQVASRMTVIAPRRPEVWFDLARLQESCDALSAAQRAYESCLEIATVGAPLHNEAAIALAMLKRRLN